MKKNKRDQDQDQNRIHKPKYKRKNCLDQFFCQNLLILNSKCKYEHKEQDYKLAKQYEKLRKIKKIVLIFEPSKVLKQGQYRAVSLHTPLLPIQIFQELLQKAEQKREQIIEKIKNNKKPGFYYEAQFIGRNLQLKKIRVKLIKQIGSFGEIKLEIQLIKTLKEPEYIFPKVAQDKKLQTGLVKMNWQRLKVLKNNSGTDKPIYPDDYNQNPYPFIEGCSVKYTTKKDKGRLKIDKVYSVKYDKFRFTGILKIDKHGVFYIKCRNWKHQSLDIVAIPQTLRQQVKQIQNCLPFTWLKPQKIKQNQLALINSFLNKFILKGEFYDWPQHCYQPIGILEQQFSPLSLKSLKQAVIYQYRINQAKSTEKQKKESQKLIKDLQKQIIKEQQITDIQTFTIDGLGTSCHDDAISIKIIGQNSKKYEVGIHIADVDEYVPYSSNLNDQIKKKDKTMYIRGFYSPMFSIPLLKYFSLSEGKTKRVYSLFFNINQARLIDFKTVQFRQSCLKIAKNYFHHKNIKQQKGLQNFFELNRIIQQSRMLKENNLLLNEQSETQTAIEGLMLISSMIPTFMWKINSERIKNAKKNVDQYIKKVVQQIKQKIKQWQNKMKLIKETQKKLSTISQQKRKINSKIEKQAELQIKKMKQAVKKQKKQQKEKRKKQSKKKQNKIDAESLSTSSEQQQQQKDAKQVTQISISDRKQIQKQMKEIKEQQQRNKKLQQTLKKQIKIGKKKQNVQQSSQSDQSDIQIGKQDYQRKKNQAKRAFNGYLTKVFQILQVDIKWQSKQQIKLKFQQAKKFDDSQIFKQYISRMYIMNHQHFKYIIQIMKQQNKQQQKNQSTTNQRNKYKEKEQAKLQQAEKQQKELGNKKYKQVYKQMKKQQENIIDKKQQIKKGQEKIEQKQKITEVSKEKPVIQAIVIKPFQVNKNNLKKRQINNEGLQVGKKWAKSNNYTHLIFKMFSNTQEDLIKQNFIKFQPAQNEQNLSKQLQANFLKFVLIGIKSRQQLKIPQKQRSDHTKKSKERAEAVYKQISKDKQIAFQKFINSQLQKIQQLIKLKGLKLDVIEIIGQAKYLNQLKKLNQNNKSKMNEKLQQKSEVKEQKKISEMTKQDYEEERTKNIQKQQDIQINKQQMKSNEQKRKKRYLTQENVNNLRNIYLKFFKNKQINYYLNQNLAKLKTNNQDLIESKQQVHLIQNKQQVHLIESKQQVQIYQKQYLEEKKNLQQKPEVFPTKKTLTKINCKKFVEFRIQDFFNDCFQLDKLIDDEIIIQDSSITKIGAKDRDYVKQLMKQKIYQQNLNKKNIKQLTKKSQIMGKKLLKQLQNLSKKQKNKQQAKQQIKIITNQIIIQEKCQKMQQFISKIDIKFVSNYQVFCYIQNLQNYLFKKYFNVDKKYKKIKETKEQIKKQKEQHVQKQQQIESNTKKSEIETNTKKSILLQQQLKTKQRQMQQKNQVKNQKLITKNQKNSQAQSNNFQAKQDKIDKAIPDKIQHDKIQQSQSIPQNSKSQKKMTKKQQKKFWQEKKKQLIKNLKQKISKDMQQKQEQGLILQSKELEEKSQLKKSLQNYQSSYNILDYVLEKMQKKKKQKGKKSRKQKKQDKKQKNKKDEHEDDSDAQNHQYIQNVFDLIQQYRKKSGHTFNRWKVSEIDKFLAQKIDINDQIIENSQKLNKQFRKLSKDQQQLLKWNNPIRSYDALQTMRIIKDCEWVFNGKISPLDILIDYQAIKLVKSRINSIEKSKIQKRESQQSDKKHKQANREIQKIQFYYKIKSRPDQEYTFLNVTSPHESVKFVFHPTLGQIQVHNKNFKQQIFKPVKGKIKIISDFPIQINAVLFQNNKN